MPRRTELLPAWVRTVRSVLPGPWVPDDVETAGAGLLDRWSTPDRAYHDRVHLQEVLDGVDLLGGATALPPDGIDAVRLAAWFHDAVYRGVSGQDEQDSAALARHELSRLGVPERVVAEVERLVLLTVAHDPVPDDEAGAVLCDADLAVLGREPQHYAAYAAAIRREYAHVPEAAFRTGRAAVLRALLDHPRLYRLDAARERWEQQARTNLAAEIADLEQPPGRLSGGTAPAAPS